MQATPLVSRRDFLRTTAAAAAALGTSAASLAQPGASGKLKLGIDNFAVRALKWKAPELIDYAASLKLDSLFITDLDAFESLEPAHLAELRKKAADRGLEIQAGTWSICPTSRTFKDKWGSAKEHLRLAIRVARALGSPVVRVILGSGEDRKTEGGIEARIADTVRVCKACRGEALDSGVKIAMENHAGDMQAWELVELIEAAGRDYVGANMDSGNALWTLEDPLASLEKLGPYVLTTSLRDGAVWESENGATVQWTAMGEGNIDFKAYFARFAELCPAAPVHIETISGFNREIPYLKRDFWTHWPKARAQDLAAFVAIAKKGQPREPKRNLNDPDYQKGEVERSIRYCREVLGLGPRA